MGYVIGTALTQSHRNARIWHILLDSAKKKKLATVR